MSELIEPEPGIDDLSIDYVQWKAVRRADGSGVQFTTCITGDGVKTWLHIGEKEMADVAGSPVEARMLEIFKSWALSHLPNIGVEVESTTEAEVNA